MKERMELKEAIMKNIDKMIIRAEAMVIAERKGMFSVYALNGERMEAIREQIEIEIIKLL